MVQQMEQTPFVYGGIGVLVPHEERRDVVSTTSAGRKSSIPSLGGRRDTTILAKADHSWAPGNTRKVVIQYLCRCQWCARCMCVDLHRTKLSWVVRATYVWILHRTCWLIRWPFGSCCHFCYSNVEVFCCFFPSVKVHAQVVYCIVGCCLQTSTVDSNQQTLDSTWWLLHSPLVFWYIVSEWLNIWFNICV